MGSCEGVAGGREGERRTGGGDAEMVNAVARGDVPGSNTAIHGRRDKPFTVGREGGVGDFVGVARELAHNLLRIDICYDDVKIV